MYKLIIGNVRISVLSDDIKRPEAIEAAKKAIATKYQKGKVLSLIEVSTGPEGLEVTTTEKTGLRTTRKTLKESMIDGIYVAIKENFYPSSAFTQKDYWFDSDTGQEWHGLCVTDAKDELFKSLEKWASSIK